MTIDLNQMPSTVTGTAPEPKEYGKSANQQYYDLTQAAKDEFQRTGNAKPLGQVNQASISYTPEGTIAKGKVTKEAIANAVGYAEQDIAHFDQNGDGALDKKEVADLYAKPFIEKLVRLKNQYGQLAANPNATQAEKVAILRQAQITSIQAQGAIAKAGNFFAAVDTRDANGQSDGKLTVDEMSAKNLFDDAVLDMFTDNQESYKAIIDGLQAKTNYMGPSFEALKGQITELQQESHSQPLAMDGQITANERDMADVLVDAPIATNQVISSIHDALHLSALVPLSATQVQSKL